MCQNEECGMLKWVWKEITKEKKKEEEKHLSNLAHIQKSLDARFSCFFSSFLPNAQSTISQFNRKCSDSHTRSHGYTRIHDGIRTVFCSSLSLCLTRAVQVSHNLFRRFFVFVQDFTHGGAEKSRTNTCAKQIVG